MPVYVIDFFVSGEITPDASFRKQSPETTFNLSALKTNPELMICYYCFRLCVSLEGEMQHEGGKTNDEVSDC